VKLRMGTYICQIMPVNESEMGCISGQLQNDDYLRLLQGLD
jgi:hypothetical protein